jgi:ATP-dependent helicase/nuclease subunit B
MDIVFGLSADAGGYPDHGGQGNGALGAPVVGPRGLLEILETALGLAAPATANVVRIAAFQAVLEKMGGSSHFWARSLEVDGWATARTLLRWRDELVDAGWGKKADWANPRLADLAAAGRAASEVPLGTTDRAAAVAANLADKPRLPIRRIRLIDSRLAHSAGWRRLLDNLENCGVVIEQLSNVPAAPEATALGRLQRWIAHGGGDLSGEPDGTVTVAISGSAAFAAEIVGQWFAARGEHEAVLIAQDSDTDLLDHGLCGAGQPRAGRSRLSAYRGALQVLLLAFKVAWRPFDPRALMELLVFPTSPIAPRAARILSAVLEEAPGRGPHWAAAWAQVGQAEIADAEDDSDKLRRAQARLARWRAWADPALAGPSEGMPLEAALSTCDRTIAWAVARHAVDGDALYQATATLALDVRKALVALGRSRLPRTLLERIIDQALDVGCHNPIAEAEASRWRCVLHPGGIWAPAETVVWWNFRATTEGLQRQPWTNAERRELAENGCPVDDAGLAAQAASGAWERAVLNARGHLLLISGGLDAGADESAHPLAHRIAPATERLATWVRLEDALARARFALAGVELHRDAVAFTSIPEPRPLWATPPGFADRLAGLAQSATSFETLLACQLMWAFKHVARLRPGRVRSIPDASRLLGNLAHALAQAIFTRGAPPARSEAAERARELLDDSIDQLAAPLRLPEFAADLADARSRLPSAMSELARILAENNLLVEDTERQINAVFKSGLCVRGAVDLIATDQDARPVIIDLKWTRSARRRLDELKEGKAVQLATYGAAVAGDGPYRAGYFLLNQRQFATVSDGGLVGRAIDGKRDFPQTWADVVESWRRLGEVAETVGLVACGVDGWEQHLPADLPILLEANCRWCDYQTLCRVRGVA